MSNANPTEVRLRAGPEEDGLRLDVVVAGVDAVGSRAVAQRLIGEGAVLVDGEARPKRHPVSAGEQIVVRIPPEEASELVPEDVPLTIVWEDSHLIVVDKPPGVVTHPSRGHDHGTLVHGLLAHSIAGGDDPRRPGIVHRLDRDTSGLIVVARTPRAHRRLQRALRAREVERRYRALVHGTPPPALTIDRPLDRHPRNRTRMAVVHRGGREAVTHIHRLERIGPYSLLDVRLETGRTHQIRAHLEDAGFPVAGDPVYGRRPAPLGLERQFLHAARIAFAHPETGEEIALESALPPDLASALAAARRLGERPRPDDR